MLESLRNIGEFSLKDQGKRIEDAHAILLENPVNETYKDVVVLSFTGVKDGELVFSGVMLDKGDNEHSEKYLYKRKGSQGANFTPCSRVAGKGVVGTFNNRILSWAKNNEAEAGSVGQLAKAIQQQREQIVQILAEKEKTEGLENTILTVQIDGKYLGEIEEFKNYFLKYYFEVKAEIAHDDGVCSLCGATGFVMGDMKPWTFYSLDKPGFVASGLVPETGWKNFPICKTCSLLVEEGKQYAEKKLSFRFTGIRYFLLPKSVTGNKKVLDDALLFLEKSKKQELHTKDLKQLADEEDEILEFASEQSDALVYNFLFYAKSKAKFTILLYLPDVLPSTLKRLFQAKEQAERPFIFKRAFKVKKEEKNIEFMFANLRLFLPTSKSFLNVVEKIFKQRPVDYHFLMARFMDRLRTQFINENATKVDVLMTLQILLLLQELNILANKSKGVLIMENDVIQNEIKQKVEQFFAQFPQTFESAEKRAIFLTGVLTQFLLNIQRRDRGAEPFRKNLKSLKMRQKDILQIFPEAQNKLEEYGENYYTQLEQIIAEYFVKAGSSWSISDDEINFYFLLGMNLADARTESGESVFKVDSKADKNNENKSIQ
ncbi:TIGR02556 family CRISPR-associated protein [Caldithrix abyssi]